MLRYICRHLHTVLAYEAPSEPLSSIDPPIDLAHPCYDQGQWFHPDKSIITMFSVFMVHFTSTTNPSTILSVIPLALVLFVSTLLPFIAVGKSSRHRDPAEVSGTFWNISLVYKFCNSLYLLTGLQRNTLYSKSNRPATAFLWQLQIPWTLDPTSRIKLCYWGLKYVSQPLISAPELTPYPRAHVGTRHR